MFTFWDLLIILVIIQIVIVAGIIYLVFRLVKFPIGIRLTLISLLFMIQGILGILIYNNWKNQGYGPEISKPLIALQSTIILGLLLLYDIVRR
ncbi:MAG: hypothetical protein F7C38_08340 [Desulfurococcales archaeon]|nr:hypothetical protein [Desulfurococcales archaeon]